VRCGDLDQSPSGNPDLLGPGRQDDITQYSGGYSRRRRPGAAGDRDLTPMPPRQRNVGMVFKTRAVSHLAFSTTSPGLQVPPTAGHAGWAGADDGASTVGDRRSTCPAAMAVALARAMVIELTCC
jgi:hypothetical protein